MNECINGVWYNDKDEEICNECESTDLMPSHFSTKMNRWVAECRVCGNQTITEEHV